MVKRYRKRPLVIEAVQFKGKVDKEFLDFVGANLDYITPGTSYNYWVVKTLEGNMRASPGDYIIKGIKGEFYPCDEDIFKKTYEEMENV